MYCIKHKMYIVNLFDINCSHCAHVFREAREQISTLMSRKKIDLCALIKQFTRLGKTALLSKWIVTADSNLNVYLTEREKNIGELFTWSFSILDVTKILWGKSKPNFYSYRYIPDHDHHRIVNKERTLKVNSRRESLHTTENRQNTQYAFQHWHLI